MSGRRRRPDRPWLGAVEMRTFVGSPRDGFTPIEQATTPAPPSYLTGGVELVVGGRPVIGLEQWTDVDWLWPFLGGLVRALDRGASYAWIAFPDAPVRFGVALQPDDLVVVVYQGHEPRRAVADVEVFFTALCEAGLAFVDHLERLVRAAEPGLRDTFTRCRADLAGEGWPSARTIVCGPGTIAAQQEAAEFFGVRRVRW